MNHEPNREPILETTPETSHEASHGSTPRRTPLRGVLGGAAALVLSVGLLAACDGGPTTEEGALAPTDTTGQIERSSDELGAGAPLDETTELGDAGLGAAPAASPEAATPDGTSGELDAEAAAPADATLEQGAEGASEGVNEAANADATEVTLADSEQGPVIANASGADEADLALTVGERYSLKAQEGDVLLVADDGSTLLTSADAEGAFASDAGVEAERHEGELTFTLTEELAQQLDGVALSANPQRTAAVRVRGA